MYSAPRLRYPHPSAPDPDVREVEGRDHRVFVARVEGLEVAVHDRGRSRRARSALGKVVEARREARLNTRRAVLLRHHVGDLVAPDGRAVLSEPGVPPCHVGLTLAGMDDARRIQPGPAPARREHLVEVDGCRVRRRIGEHAAVEISRRPHVRVLERRRERGRGAAVPGFDEAVDGLGGFVAGQGGSKAGRPGGEKKNGQKVSTRAHRTVIFSRPISPVARVRSANYPKTGSVGSPTSLGPVKCTSSPKKKYRSEGPIHKT